MPMLRLTIGATAMATGAMVATVDTEVMVATTAERGMLMLLLSLLLMLMPMLMLRLTTGAMVATTVATEAMVATTVERGLLMLMLMLMPMLRPTTGVMAMATGVTEATMVATGADTGAKGIHHFQNSVRVLCIRPNDFKAL